MTVKFKIQNSKSKILIVGAGPAGASLAIRLAKKNFDITLVEREKFPRHKLCGEFISPECLSHFKELGVFGEMISAGGERITETVFYEPGGNSVSVPSKWFGGDLQGALGLSRAEMDFRLLEKAKEAGAEVLEEYAAIGLLSSKEGNIRGLRFRTVNGNLKEITADLIIDATGRARVIAKLADKNFLTQRRQNNSSNYQVPTTDHKKEARVNRVRTTNNEQIQNPKSKIQNRFVGFKAHLENVNLSRGVCEIYFFRGGYGGLSHVENNFANHCFLIRAEVVKQCGGDAERIVKEVIFQNKRAFQTMKDAAPVSEWLAVSVDGFGGKNLNPAKNIFAVGDASAFIDPFTGSGMLMAFEGAEILAEVIAENYLSPERITEKYQLRHAAKFRKRLRVSALLRRAAFVPALAKLAISGLGISAKLREILARQTRQPFRTDENK